LSIVPDGVINMGTFSKIFGSGDKKLQERANKILLDLSKGLQSASAKLCVAATEWREGNIKVLEEIREEIITLEREMDNKKEELIEQILCHRAFLPQQSEERHHLATLLDSIIDTAEHAVRVMYTGRRFKPPKILEKLAKKVWTCTDNLQDAVKYLYSNFSKSVEVTREVDKLREDARDYEFELLEEVFNNDKYSAAEIQLFVEAAHWITKVAVQAEVTGDYLRELAVRYS
jgi:predicted phosphate transport protein (TIGR00153 family)